MEYINVFGETVPVLGYGTWQIKGEFCTKAVKDALKLGYRHIDTAQRYKNEENVGKAIDESDVKRDEIFLTTKVWRSNLSYEDVLVTTKESLKKLKTEYVNLLLIHWPNDEIEISETLKAMQELKEDEKIKHIGVSNFTLGLLKEAQKKSEEKIFCNQVEYHPFILHNELLQYCQENNIILTAYSPLARGKVTENELLKKIGQKYDKTPAQVSLRYLIQQDMVCAIPKASNPKHRKENIKIFDFTLTPEEMERISKLSDQKKLIQPSFSPW
ncbi:aldo/keto reductase [archaeon SCG-AAA382B04]|nr:aldo/keto reductase [archaeon SCG-AAA382B04]